MSTQIGLDPKAFKKLQSCFVAAEAACSKGDLPVVTVDIALAAVLGLATATDTAALPAVLAALVVAPPRATNGAAQPARTRLVVTLARIMKSLNIKAAQAPLFLSTRLDPLNIE